MKCQILFSNKNKKNIIKLSSAELECKESVMVKIFLQEQIDYYYCS